MSVIALTLTSNQTGEVREHICGSKGGFWEKNEPCPIITTKTKHKGTCKAQTHTV